MSCLRHKREKWLLVRFSHGLILKLVEYLSVSVGGNIAQPIFYIDHSKPVSAGYHTSFERASKAHSRVVPRGDSRSRSSSAASHSFVKRSSEIRVPASAARHHHQHTIHAHLTKNDCHAHSSNSVPSFMKIPANMYVQNHQARSPSSSDSYLYP